MLPITPYWGYSNPNKVPNNSNLNDYLLGFTTITILTGVFMAESSMRYPVGVRQLEHGLELFVPNVDNKTQVVDSYETAQSKAMELLDSHFSELADLGRLPPEPMSLDVLINTTTKNIVWLLVEVNLEPYLGRSSKVNVTLPNLLRKQIDDTVSRNFNYKDRSDFIQTAAINELSGAKLIPHYDGLIIKQGDIQIYISNKDEFKFRTSIDLGLKTRSVVIELLWLSIKLPYKYLPQIEEFAGVTLEELKRRWEEKESSEHN